MLFSSTEYLLLVPLAFIVFYFLLPKKAGVQNLFLLLISLILYACWDQRFLLLMLASALVNYVVGIQLSRQIDRKKTWLWLGIGFNLLILLIFKYFNFFISGFDSILQIAGISWGLHTLKILVPLGLSYFTFQSLGYLIDCYRNKIDDPRSSNLFLLLLFFPKVIAGPIERSSEFLLQLKKDKIFVYEDVVEGLRQILWGVFKKIVIADNAGIILNIIYSGEEVRTGSTVLISVLLYSVQIYADFSGYSDIAIGSARLFGIKLQQNFNYPYFSKGIREFWRRWHMSLMTWFRDYLFLPLSYWLSRKMKKNSYLGLNTDKLIYGIATFVTFILCGLWHGAGYTYVFWGLLNAVWFLPFILGKKKKKKHFDPWINNLFGGLNIILTFLLVTFTWIFFRANSLGEAFHVIGTIFSPSIVSLPEFAQYKLIFLVPLMFYVEWQQRDKLFALSFVGIQTNLVQRWTIYLLLIGSIYFLGCFNSRIEFLYFGF